LGKFSGNNHEKHEIDNRANQLNPNNEKYTSPRGKDYYDDFDDENNYSSKPDSSISEKEKKENNKPTTFEDKINKLSNIKRGIKMEFIKINKGTYVGDSNYCVEIDKDIYLNINSLTTFQFYKPDRDIIYKNSVKTTFEKDKYNIFEIAFAGIYGYPEVNSDHTFILIPADDESQNKRINTLIESVDKK